MAQLEPDNPFIPANIGLRDSAAIPAAIIRLVIETWMTSNCLTLGDRVSMSEGVESRQPFLHAELIELVMAVRSVAPDHRMGSKALLRAALKGVLPDEVLARPKAGFQPPVKRWLSGVIAKHGNILRAGRLVADGILEKNKIEYILTDMIMEGWKGLFMAYKLVLLEMWYQKIVEARNDAVEGAQVPRAAAAKFA